MTVAGWPAARRSALAAAGSYSGAGSAPMSATRHVVVKLFTQDIPLDPHFRFPALDEVLPSWASSRVRNVDCAAKGLCWMGSAASFLQVQVQQGR